jgi:hypothetical protein
MENIEPTEKHRQEAVLNEIRAERQYQDSIWGGPEHDDTNTERNWADYIVEYLSGLSPRTQHKGFRERMVKVAALAVAAIESHDRAIGRGRAA